MVNIVSDYGSPLNQLLGICFETGPYRRINNDWEFCPNVFPLFTTHIPGTETFDCDNPINHISNIPQNYEHQFVSEGYELEIIDGIMSINFIFEEETKVRISIEEFKKFHNAYCHVKVTHEPMEFDIELL
ncbi:hypothetical protein [Sphingorhabdus sp.]|uniref:hypothetical protein n=1 Tax=Sphingorhabdus sp. TaxID=1902408 RepID=UPI003D81AEE9